MTNQHNLAFDWDGLTLAGTLYLPAEEGAHPVVLMMQGSGPADRDSNGYFPPIRDAFLGRGLATFAFDKPGVGGSSGDWRDYALEGRADQAIAAIEMLLDYPQIDAQRVGIWGHSQGGWLAQLIASRLPELPFAIANSGPSINVELQDLYGCEHTMRANGHTEADIKLALEFLDAIHRAARRGDDYATVESDLLVRARQRPWYGYMEIDDPETWRFLCIAEQFEPVEALSRTRCPFLAIYGGLDPLVPAWQSAEESGRALHQAGNTDATIIVFPQGDHRIRDANTGDFATGYLDLMGDWAAQRAGMK